MNIQPIELTSIVLAILSIIAAIFGYFISRGIKEYRYKPWMYTVVAMTISILSISTVFYLYKYKISKTNKPSDIQSQLARIDNVQKSLSDLNKFLSEQRRRLNDAETTIRNLENERDKLKPLVETDRKTVEALARIIEEKRSANIWKERIISFLLGIISSLLAAVLIRLTSTKIKSKKPFVTILPKRISDKLLFYDDFRTFEGWQDYKRGTISHSNDYSHKGDYSLKKHGNNDPNGGYKIFPKSISVGFSFSGWIYRPSGKPGGKADRLAVENSNFNGYGFCVAHGSNKVSIESREDGRPTRQICSKDNVNCPEDAWYKFLFSIKPGGVLELKIFDSNENELTSFDSQDTRFDTFDRIVIHGGQPYYVDELHIDELAT